MAMPSLVALVATTLSSLAEVGDIRRFPSARKLHSYLGVVPTVRSSGGVTRNGAINRRSRGLSRSLFTQAAIHLVDSYQRELTKDRNQQVA